MTVFPEQVLSADAREAPPPPEHLPKDDRQLFVTLSRAVSELCALSRGSRNIPDYVDREAARGDVRHRAARLSRILRSFQDKGMLEEACKEVANVMEAQDPATRDDINRLLDENGAPARVSHVAGSSPYRPYNTGVRPDVLPSTPPVASRSPWSSAPQGPAAQSRAAPFPGQQSPPQPSSHPTGMGGGSGGYGGGAVAPFQVRGFQFPMGQVHASADVFRTLPPPRPPAMQPGLLDDVVGAGWAAVAMGLQAFASYFVGRIIGQGHRPMG